MGSNRLCRRNAVPGRRSKPMGIVDLVKEDARVNIESHGRVRQGGDRLRLLHPHAEGLPRTSSPVSRSKRRPRPLAKRVTHISEFVAQSAGETGHGPSAVRRSARWHLPFLLSSASRGSDQGASRDSRRLPGMEYVEMTGCRSLRRRSRDLSREGFRYVATHFERKRRTIEQSGAEIVATSCPACMIQLRTGLQGAAESNMWRSCSRSL